MMIAIANRAPRHRQQYWELFLHRHRCSSSSSSLRYSCLSPLLPGSLRRGRPAVLSPSMGTLKGGEGGPGGGAWAQQKVQPDAPSLML